MDPVLQVLQQARSGSAEGEGFGRDYFQGKQLNLMQQRLNMEKREQDALLPLKQKLLRYDALQRGLEMGTALTEEDVTLQMNAFLPKVNDLLLRFMRSPKGFSDDSLINEYQTLYSQNPWAFSAGNGARIKQGMDAQLMQRNNWIQVLEHDEELKKRGLFLRSLNPKTGDIDIGIRDEEMRRQRLQNEIRRLELEEARLSQSGDRNALASIRLQKEALLDNLQIQGLPAMSGGLPKTSSDQPSASPTQTEPATNAPPASVSFRPIEGPITRTTTVQLQKENIAADRALHKLDTLTDTIRSTPEAFGLRGVGGEILETVQGQFNPNLDPKISNAREQAGLAFVELADSLRTDTGNMSRYEQERLKELGDTRTWKDYPARALGKAETIKKAIIAKKLRIMKGLNAKPDDTFLKSIPSSEIAGLYSSGLISKEAALRWHDLKRAEKGK